LITACIAHKARVVEEDEKETGERRSLNVGHTTGHAIELSHGFSHGESVLWGMIFETKIAVNEGVCEKEYGEKLLEIVENALNMYGERKVDFSQIDHDAQKARLDKKNTDAENIKMSVAKSKNQWKILSLPFEKYQKALIEIAATL
jgi:3-dehydroquinate synthetase